MKNKYSISFVIPVYKSEKTIASVVGDISKLKNIDWEVILVNDNSPDGVDKVIKELIKKYPKKITYLRFRKNYGQHSAIIEGFRYVTKDLVATIDDDGQNPPIEILKMADFMVKNDYDVVYGAPKDKQHSFFRRMLSVLNRLVSVLILNNRLKIPVSNIRIIRKNVVTSMAANFGNFNYIEGIIFSLTDYIGCIKINHKKRIEGKSSYTFKKLIKLWLNHIFGYSNIFMKGISALSFTIALFAFLVGVIYFFLTINIKERPLGWLSTYLTMTFLFSVMFFVLGLLIEYVGRIYIKINQAGEKIINKIYIHD